jgi:hypothetical protein
MPSLVILAKRQFHRFLKVVRECTLPGLVQKVEPVPFPKSPAVCDLDEEEGKKESIESRHTSSKSLVLNIRLLISK